VNAAANVTKLLLSFDRKRQNTPLTVKSSRNENAAQREVDGRNLKIKVAEDRYAVELSKIHLRLVISLLFAVLPGETLIPSLAHGLAPVSASAPVSMIGIDTASSYVMLSNLPPDSDPQLARQSADAARLLLEDYTVKKRPKLPASVKRQMDLQDNRLANCQESSEVGNWDQCFFYGMDTPTSDVADGERATYYYFGNGVTSSTPSSPTAIGKSKIPTW